MSGLFSTPKPPKIPPPPKPKPMPDPDDLQARQARRAQMEMSRQRAGRESTILSSDGSAGDYAKKSLG